MKIQFLSVSQVKSPASKQSAVHIAITPSVIGYLTDILLLQYLHFPFKNSQLKIGNKSKNPSTCPQVGQWLRPFKNDSPFAILKATQLRNDPITAPNITAIIMQYTKIKVLS